MGIGEQHPTDGFRGDDAVESRETHNHRASNVFGPQDVLLHHATGSEASLRGGANSNDGDGS